MLQARDHRAFRTNADGGNMAHTTLCHKCIHCEEDSHTKPLTPGRAGKARAAERVLAMPSAEKCSRGEPEGRDGSGSGGKRDTPRVGGGGRGGWVKYDVS